MCLLRSFIQVFLKKWGFQEVQVFSGWERFPPAGDWRGRRGTGVERNLRILLVQSVFSPTASGTEPLPAPASNHRWSTLLIQLQSALRLNDPLPPHTWFISVGRRRTDGRRSVSGGSRTSRVRGGWLNRFLPRGSDRFNEKTFQLTGGDTDSH